MKVATFLERFLKRYEAQITEFAVFKDGGSNRSYMNWDLVYRLKEATQYIDYDCQFDHNGLCKNRRERYKSISMKQRESMCCCVGCGTTLGYLYNIENDHYVIETIAKRFDTSKWKRGFWRPGEGCILPRKYRSTVCLIHSCKKAKTKAENDLLEAISQGPRWILKHVDDDPNMWWAVNHLIVNIIREDKERRKKK